MKLLINTKNVRKVPVTLAASGASKTRLVVPLDQRVKDGLQKYGMANLADIGDKMLPMGIGPATRRNLLGKVIIHRNQPKEPYSVQVLWGRNQFCGRDETEWVEDYITRNGFRYPRTQLPPENIELSLIENSKGERMIGTDVIDISAESRWVTAANVMLEIFGLTWAVDPSDLDIPLMVTQRVNWRMLPKGRCPWNQLRPQMNIIVQNLRNETHRNVAIRKLEVINRFNPDQVIIGEGGFNRYVAFSFPDRGFTLLESIEPNNATYILGSSDWKVLSKLSKGEILSADRHMARFVHGPNWDALLADWFRRHEAA